MNPHGSPKRARGMSRHAKIFYKIDKEGLLMETLSITGTVNFDCYESIVTSAQRVLASHHSLKATNICVERIFYYKKRARSNRMNPAQIQTTTDVFRAVAEHPAGEVPLGVLWSHKEPSSNVPPTVPKFERSRTHQAMVDKEAYQTIRQNVKEEVEERTVDDEVPLKRQRTEYPHYTFKTYMPNSSELTPRIVSVTSQFTGEQSPGTPNTLIGQPVPAALDAKSVAGSERTGANDPKSLPAFERTGTVEEEFGPSEPRVKNLQSKSAYQWPGNVTCEVILHYDGISERKVLTPGLSNVVEHIVRGNFSQLSNETVNTLRMGTKDLLEVFKEVNSVDRPVDPLTPVTGNKEPIKYLHSAKTEMFKLLSLVNLSRSKFKQLLDWMKTLKLEEGKQGKFYLSERNIVGGGMKVTFDTDMEAAERLNNLYKNRNQTVKAKVVYPINPYVQPKPINDQQAQQVAMAMPDGTTGNQIMFLVPQSNIDGATPTLIPVSGASLPQAFIPATGSGAAPTLVPISTNTTQAFIPATNPSTAQKGAVPSVLTSTAQALKKKLNQSSDSSSVSAESLKDLLKDTSNSTSRGKSSKTSAQLTDTAEFSNESTPSPSEPAPTKSIPAILRRKQKNPTQKRKGSSPVPLHLYRSYGTGDEEEEGDFATFGDSTLPDVVVKQEQEDYNSDATDDYTDNSSAKFTSPGDEDSFGDGKRYNTVLKSDACMSQTADQSEGDKPFEIIIKSEPVDTYD